MAKMINISSGSKKKLDLYLLQSKTAPVETKLSIVGKDVFIYLWISEYFGMIYLDISGKHLPVSAF